MKRLFVSSRFLALPLAAQTQVPKKAGPRSYKIPPSLGPA